VCVREKVRDKESGRCAEVGPKKKQKLADFHNCCMRVEVLKIVSQYVCLCICVHVYLCDHNICIYFYILYVHTYMNLCVYVYTYLCIYIYRCI